MKEPKLKEIMLGEEMSQRKMMLLPRYIGIFHPRKLMIKNTILPKNLMTIKNTIHPRNLMMLKNTILPREMTLQRKQKPQRNQIIRAMALQRKQKPQRNQIVRMTLQRNEILHLRNMTSLQSKRTLKNQRIL